MSQVGALFAAAASVTTQTGNGAPHTVSASTNGALGGGENALSADGLGGVGNVGGGQQQQIRQLVGEIKQMVNGMQNGQGGGNQLGQGGGLDQNGGLGQNGQGGLGNLSQQDALSVKDDLHNAKHDLNNGDQAGAQREIADASNLLGGGGSNGQNGSNGLNGSGLGTGQAGGGGDADDQNGVSGSNGLNDGSNGLNDSSNGLNGLGGGQNGGGGGQLGDLNSLVNSIGNGSGASNGAGGSEESQESSPDSEASEQQGAQGAQGGQGGGPGGPGGGQGLGMLEGIMSKLLSTVMGGMGG